jgi:hypothetical protein
MLKNCYVGLQGRIAFNHSRRNGYIISVSDEHIHIPNLKIIPSAPGGKTNIPGVTELVTLSKQLHMDMCPTPNVFFRDRSISLCSLHIQFNKSAFTVQMKFCAFIKCFRPPSKYPQSKNIFITCVWEEGAMMRVSRINYSVYSYRRLTELANDTVTDISTASLSSTVLTPEWTFNPHNNL